MRMLKRIIFITFLSITLFSCGGGTHGSGGQSFEGVVTKLSSDGSTELPVDNAIVKISMSEDFTTTDESGFFTIDSENRFNGDVKFEVIENDGTVSSVILKEVSISEDLIQFCIILQENKNLEPVIKIDTNMIEEVKNHRKHHHH